MLREDINRSWALASTILMMEVGWCWKRRNPSKKQNSSLGQSSRDPYRRLSKTPCQKLRAISRIKLCQSSKFHCSRKGCQFEPYAYSLLSWHDKLHQWLPCGVTWDAAPKTVMVLAAANLLLSIML